MSKTLPDGRRIHSIISDVTMPKTGGIALVTEKRKLNNYQFTPVIMLSTESRGSMKSEGQAAGARGWVVKPFPPQQLLEVVSKLVAA